MRLLWFVSEPVHSEALRDHLNQAGLRDDPRHRSTEGLAMAPSCECFELSLDDAIDLPWSAWATDIQTDALVLDTPPPRLALFDMDSTLIQHEVIDELATEFGLGEEVSAITARAMRGELDFVSSFTERLGLLAGLSEGALQSVYERLHLMPGADVLMANLKSAGIRTGIVSGGFSFFADRVAARLAMDFVMSNALQCREGYVTGQVVPPVIDGAMKASRLHSEVRSMGIDVRQTMAVGDGANDIPMLLAAGTGVAFHAKPAVAELARHIMRHQDLSALSYVLPA